MQVDILWDLLKSITQIDEVDEPSRAVDVFLSSIRRFGFDHALVTGLPSSRDPNWSESILCHGWPTEWYDRYIEQEHFPFDPCAERCRHEGSPFSWSELAHERLTPRSKVVMDEASEFGMNDGFCVPIHVPMQPPAVVTIAGEKPEFGTAAIVLLEALSHHLFRALSRLSGGESGEELPALTPRELEVAKWASDGKNPEDIACLLGISIHTSERHLRNIREKLEASNTVHAIAKALRSHQIW